MKGIMITAPGSGSGKTMITVGILRALLNMGFDVCAFKTGPDYIDTAFLKEASKKEAGNLDLHLQGEEGLKKSLHMGEGEYCVIEGAMGYFDGIYNTFENSSFDISRQLNVNSILVYTPEAEMFSAVPKIKGMAEFEGSTIKGVILNRVTEKHYKMLKVQIEKYTGLYVLGFVPEIHDMEIESRHLGLVQSMEIIDMDIRIEKAAEAIQKNIDIEFLINIMEDIEDMPAEYPEKRNIKVAIAKDKAFSFYYRENLKLLSNCCSVEYFSPLRDGSLPECDLLYLGGGYPEVFRRELSDNKSMLSSIKAFAQSGGCIFAECGGFMYLTEYIEGSSMAGIFEGRSIMTEKLQHFGYADIRLKEDCMLGKKGDRLTAQEFHKSVSEVNGNTLYRLNNTMGENVWHCGYSYKNVLAGYPHINFLGNMNSFLSMLDYVENKKMK
jgi:cobyrinic acid a,c-diamide synthase